MAINETFKTHLKEFFCSWYAEIVTGHLDGCLAVDNVKVGLHAYISDQVQCYWLACPQYEIGVQSKQTADMGVERHWILDQL